MFSQKGNNEKKTCCVRPEFVYDSLATTVRRCLGSLHEGGISVGSRKWFLLATSFRALIAGAGE